MKPSQPLARARPCFLRPAPHDLKVSCLGGRLAPAIGHQATVSARDCLPPSCPLVLGGEPLQCAAYSVTVSLFSYLPRRLASDRGAGSRSRAALPSSLRRLRAVLAQVEKNERVLPSATEPGRIVQASQDAAQMTARPCRMGVPAPLSRQVLEPAARPQRVESGRRAPERRD